MAKIVSKGHKAWKDGSAMTYTITDDGILTISGSLPKCESVVIRSKAPFRHLVIAEGVTSIGCENFYGMDELEELSLAGTVTTIGFRAFCCCRNLKIIHFSEGLELIRQMAFENCEALTDLSLPQSLRRIEGETFIRCKGLTKVRLPECLDYIPDGMFAGCESLKDVKLPKGLRQIHASAFSSCDSLKKITFPAGLKGIGDMAFCYCDNLHDIIFPPDIALGRNVFCRDVSCKVKGEDGFEYECLISEIKTNRSYVTIEPAEKVHGDIIVPGHIEYEGKEYDVTVIAGGAFSQSEITSVVLPDTIKVIKARAFEYCHYLKSAELGKSLRIIGDQAFQECGNLLKVNLGPVLEHIGYEAFSYCKYLRHMTIPDTVERIRRNALKETFLADNKDGVIYFGKVLYGYSRYGALPPHTYIEVREGTKAIADGAFREKKNLEGIILPEGIKKIGDGAFWQCRDLRYVKFPRSLVTIGADAFDITDIKEIAVPWRKPVEISNSPFPEGITIHIPKGSMEAYSKDKNWKAYNLIEK